MDHDSPGLFNDTFRPIACFIRVVNCSLGPSCSSASYQWGHRVDCEWVGDRSHWVNSTATLFASDVWDHGADYEWVGKGWRVSMQRPAFTRLVAGVAGLSNRVWLSGPSGSELYQEQLVRYPLLLPLLLMMLTRLYCWRCCCHSCSQQQMCSYGPGAPVGFSANLHA